MSGFTKRVLDITAALFGMVLLSPLMLAIALSIRWKMGRPVMFRQRRPGYRGRPFTMLKFRTMTEGDTAATHHSDADRLTPLGSRLRSHSLDELPQLWNVLQGEMSLVGPRPLLMEYLGRYTPEQARRHNAKPGITGWAQVQGRQEIPFSRRLELDVWYVDHQSFSLDLRILWMTLTKMLGGSGVQLGQDVRLVDDVGLHPVTRKREGLND
jgi:lipopolysaccharide/colanic/teichoic acid biosynthesis glycosyltransferase